MRTHALRKACLTACFLLLTSTGVLASDPLLEARRDAQHRINVSGRQSMLSERIAKAACLAARDPTNGSQVQELFEAREIFMFSRKALRTGDVAMGLAPETSLAPVLVKAADLAHQYDGTVYDFAAALPTAVKQPKLEKIYELSLPVLTGLNDAVEYLELQHKDGHLMRRGLASALNVSGQQRTLSQKMAKEVCEIASGYEPRETRLHLKGTIALFMSSHELLKRSLIELNMDVREGMPIASQLMLIERHWAGLSKLYTQISEGGAPSDEDLATVAAESKVLLGELNRTVELYEAIDIPPAMN
jgi:Type IV pili methyl-accepting chemotaxis transducer N-term